MNIKKMIKDNDFKIKKQFGQNFLVDQNVLNRIINVVDINNKNIIEIGPGLGSLTELLVSVAKKVICYEIDIDAINILKNKFINNKNLTIINQDFLKADLKKDIYNYFNNEEVIIVANLPYYITTAITTKVLEETNLISSLVIMMQQEVAMRFVGKPSTKDYNSLSVLIQYYTNSRLAFNVSRNSFIPVPDVDSSVVLLDRKKVLTPTVLDEEFFKKFNRIIFSQRRKTLVNNLKKEFKISSEDMQKILNDNNINLTVRAESLTYQQIATLSNSFYKYFTK